MERTPFDLPFSIFFFALPLFAAPAIRANPITDSALFKSLVGQWEGEGTLTNPQDGTVTEVKETWTGELNEAGTFAISGRRRLDQNEHDFAWEFFVNNEFIEGQMKMSEPEIDLRFEATVNEAERSITLKVALTGGGGTLTIVNAVSEDGRTLEGKVELVDDTGKTTSTGKVTHRKTGAAGN